MADGSSSHGSNRIRGDTRESECEDLRVRGGV